MRVERLKRIESPRLLMSVMSWALLCARAIPRLSSFAQAFYPGAPCHPQRIGLFATMSTSLCSNVTCPRVADE